MNSPVPNADGAFLPWLNNFSMKLPGYAAAFGLTAAETAQTAADYTMLEYLLAQIGVFTNDSQSRTAYKNTLVRGALGSAIGPFPTSPVFGAVPPNVPVGIRARALSLVQRITPPIRTRSGRTSISSRRKVSSIPPPTKPRSTALPSPVRCKSLSPSRKETKRCRE